MAYQVTTILGDAIYAKIMTSITISKAVFQHSQMHKFFRRREMFQSKIIRKILFFSDL